MICYYFRGNHEVQFAAMQVHQLRQSNPSRTSGVSHVVKPRIFAAFQIAYARIVHSVASNEHSVARALNIVVFQTELQPHDFVGVDIAKQPRICVVTRIAMQQRGNVLVQCATVLHALAYAAANGGAVLILVESANRGFGANNTGARDKKIGTTENVSRVRLHRNCEPAFRSNFHDDVSVLTVDVG